VRPRVWVGINVGKTSHYVCAVDESGKVTWSQKVANEQRAIEQLIDRARKSAERVQHSPAASLTCSGPCSATGANSALTGRPR